MNALKHIIKHRANHIAKGIVLALYVFSGASFAQTTPSFNTFITATAIENIPASNPEKHYSCSDKIYAVIEVTEPDMQVPSEHKLTVNWYDPGNQLEQKTRYTFTSYGKGTRIWAWLKLSGPSGAAIARIFDPAFGMGKFIGNWRAEVIIDNKSIAVHKFDIIC